MGTGQSSAMKETTITIIVEGRDPTASKEITQHT